jgi:thiol-disulfide isomerase/thioredoxin
MVTIPRSLKMNVYFAARFGRCVPVVVCFTLLLPLGMSAQAKPVSEGTITNEIGKLRSTPDAQRGAFTGQIAMEIRALPAGSRKLALADELSHLATEGDPGRDNLQAVTTTLAQALSESPIPAKGDKPAMPYTDLARLVRYEGMKTDFADPQLIKAHDILVADDAGIEKLDFTLGELQGKKKVTLSELRGKIVVVNFWATWCPPCRKEIPDLDTINRHFADQGLVVLAVTDENMFKVNGFFSTMPSFPVLLDPGHKVGNEFHVDGLPRTFVFNREGKLVAESIDMRTQRQFLNMLAAAGLKPE